MPAKGFLTKQQLKKLQAALRESGTAQLRERILMLLLMNDGKTYREISEFIGCSRRLVKAINSAPRARSLLLFNDI
jgi:DNA-binding CsgD family transcriptional regulator